MQVTVRLFASLRERAGWGERCLELHDRSASPAAIWHQLAGGLGQTQALPPTIRVAINQRFAAADTPLADGDEVAFLPPISGG